MPALHENLRRQLEKVVIAAREAAEAAAKAALHRLAVDQPEPFKHLTPAQRKLRNELRARARQLGDLLEQKKQAIDHLTHELAYEHWHRMLFARFLAENNLLIHPELGVPVTLAECEDLAKEEAAATSTKPDAWAVAGRFASRMLPQIFRPDDPLLQVTFAPEDQQALEKLLVSLPGGEHGVFTADDSLGWVYQFWQSKRKDEVNASGEKITGDTLPAVTQLFTEHYMVLFLLHNTVGAWHAGKVLAANPKLATSAKSEDEIRKAVALSSGGGYSFDYLRFVRGTCGTNGPWRPAAGTFDDWPKHASELKTLDPCCGSGHFLVALFELLVRLRMEEDGVSAADATDGVLRDNVNGLELDQRCTQIAAFNLAMAAWKFAGYRPLPQLNIACTGLGPRGKKDDWLKLADSEASRHREPIRFGLGLLHDAFIDAPTVGSLIDPKRVTGTMGAADFESLAPALATALAVETSDDIHADAVTAQGLLRAAELLAGPESGYTLVITNVPYLAQRRQGSSLRQYLVAEHADAKADLATAMIDRYIGSEGGAACFAAVTPQHWLFQDSYLDFRIRLLRTVRWVSVAALGPGAFETISGEIVNVALPVIARGAPESAWSILAIDCSTKASAKEKTQNLISGQLSAVKQASQLANPDARITLSAGESTSLLGEFASAPQGIITGDLDHWQRVFWELRGFDSRWRKFLSTTPVAVPYAGREHAVDWADEGADMVRPRPGNVAVGRDGVAISQIGHLPATMYLGELYDGNVAPIIPHIASRLPAIYTFCGSKEFHDNLRVLDKNMKVTNGVLLKATFDFAYWQQAAAERYPNGLPEPESDDPTQWLFHGRPEASESPLQVAMARLVGYRWPAELDETMRLSERARRLVKQCDGLLALADEDGIVCIPSVRGEDMGAERLLAMLGACGLKADRELDDYLRNTFFEEHFKLFHHRPFVWHIWDGRKDGFHALINYHKLADGKRGTKLLDILTYSYLGDWIARQKADVKAEKAGAEARLVAASDLQKKLEAVATGEPPFDIFVRWKPLHEQPIGWEPDLNDGVRLNIRPFMNAGILRKNPNIKWTKDRGKDPETAPWFKVFAGERINDHHLTNAEKLAARERLKK